MEPLDKTSFPAWRDGILAYDATAVSHEPRRYPGYPLVGLPKPTRRVPHSLEGTLRDRRSLGTLAAEQLPAATLSRILHWSHGLDPDGHRGRVPSAGSLQALELYLAPLVDGWLDPGAYHYDRPGHALSRLNDGAKGREAWQDLVPSLLTVEGGALLWLIVGDAARLRAKYGERGAGFLYLEAGHLMQNLCLVSAAHKCSTVPLGGFFEAAIGRRLQLPGTDRVLYAGICGRP